MAKRKVTINDLKAVIERNRAFLSEAETRARDRLEAAAVKLERRISGMFTAFSTSKTGSMLGLKTNLAQAQKIHTRLAGLFDEIYRPAFAAVVKDFDAVAAMSVSAPGFSRAAAKFTDIDREMINVLKSSAYDTFETYGDMAQNRIATAMYDQIIGGAPFGDLVSEVRGILSGEVDARGRSMLAYAEQHANDSLMQFNRSVATTKAENIGLDHFIYYGDEIRTTRDFCAERVGNVYSLEEIESWNDIEWSGKSGPPLTHCGGWNCRHSWVAIDPEWFPEGIEAQRFQ